MLYLHLIRKYEIPVDSKWNRVALVDALLNAQHTDGGWTYDSASSKDSASSVDVTGMVLSALAPYQEREDVKPAVQKAVAYIYNEQLENGGFSADGQVNSNSLCTSNYWIITCERCRSKPST